MDRKERKDEGVRTATEVVRSEMVTAEKEIGGVCNYDREEKENEI